MNNRPVEPTGRTPGLNPFLPFDLCIPDGEPKVFGDRVYLYGSLDRTAGCYCSHAYHVVSAPLCDLTAWVDHGESFSSAAVPWSDAALYAPDVLLHKGTYYLFFCMADGSEGVAQSDAPEGPFSNPRRITCGGEPIRGIDPSVLADKGHIYYTWGQFELQMAELNDDLCSLRPETVHRGVLSNADGREGFHEGSSLRKLGDHYCLIYASEYTDDAPHHGARPTKLDYAVSTDVFGPYERRGTVIDNDGCDEATWNNHGSIVKLGAQWYVFYHASSENSVFLRRARAERLQVDEARGVIEQAAPTANGFVRLLLPQMLTSPLHACRFFGGAWAKKTADGRFAAVCSKKGAGFTFSPARFAEGRYRLALTYRCDADGGIRLFLGDRAAGTAALPASPDGSAALVFFAAAGDFPLRLQSTGDRPCTVFRLQIDKTETV